MEQILLLKCHQCLEFKQALKATDNDTLVYKQVNFDKSDLVYWSYNHSNLLIQVMPCQSMIGNNYMGQLFMKIRDRI